MKKHPASTFIYIYLCDALALMASINAIIHMNSYPATIWITFVIWTIFLCVARIGGIFEFIGIKVATGWATAVEVAVLFILPFPILCISMLISYVSVVISRIYKKHPEPFIGPDFNASNNIIAAFISISVYEKIVLYLSDSIFITIVPLMAATLIYAAIVVILLTTLISIDEHKPWLSVGTITADSLVTESVLIITGALIGRVYTLDPFLITLVLFPLLMLHNLLSKINEAKLIYIDEKTGLNNYRYFDEKFDELFEKAKSLKQPLSLIFGDMDYLRNVNNTYGHQVGDQALITIANVLKGNSPENAVCARFGGEEFVVLIPNCDKYKAAKVAEIIRSKIESSKITIEGGKEIQVTMSFGVADYPSSADNIEALSKNSDKAVYEAKRLGRNRVEIYSQDLNSNG